MVEPRERRPGRHARETFLHQDDIHAHIVFGDDVRETPLVDIEPFAIAFEPHPAVQHEARELVARGIGKRRRGVEHAADFRRVDAEQTHAAERRDVNGIAIDHGADEHERRSLA